MELFVDAMLCHARRMIADAYCHRAQTALVKLLLFVLLTPAARAEIKSRPRASRRLLAGCPHSRLGLAAPSLTAPRGRNWRALRPLPVLLRRPKSWLGNPSLFCLMILYLDYSRTGNRDRCQKVLSERADRVATFTLAECLENRGRFVGPLTETLEALCKERAGIPRS